MADYEILTPGVGEIVEKKSRFIGSCAHVTSEEEALAFVAAKKKEHYDARHNCFAYIIGARPESADESGNIIPASPLITRSSDDGEPSGTAGRPMLDVMTGRGLYDAVIVVTRYFGGVLLGTGGLVRAYSAATTACIDACELIERRTGLPLTITTDYGNVGRMQHIIADRGLYLKDTLYDADVRFICMVPTDQKDAITSLITNETSGTATLEWGPEESYTVKI